MDSRPEAEEPHDGEAAELGRLVARTHGLQPGRRLFHAGNGLVAALVPGALGVERSTVVWVLGATFAGLLAFDLIRLRAPHVNVVFYRAFPSFASPREKGKLASSTWYALGLLLTWAFFPSAVAIPAILVLALADPTASMLGRLYGRHRLGKGSVEGCTAFFVMASAVLLVTVGGLGVVGVAALVTLLEIAPWRADDNITIPLGTAVLLSLLSGLG